MKHRPWINKIETVTIDVDCTEIVLPVVEEVREEEANRTKLKQSEELKHGTKAKRTT